MADEDRYITHILVLSILFMSVTAVYFQVYSGLSSTESTRATVSVVGIAENVSENITPSAPAKPSAEPVPGGARPRKIPQPEFQKPPLEADLRLYPSCTEIPISVAKHSDFVKLLSAVREPNSTVNSSIYFQDFLNASFAYEQSGNVVGKDEITLIVFDLKGARDIGSIVLELEIPRSRIREYGIDPDTLTLLHRYPDGSWRASAGVLQKIGENSTALRYLVRMEKQEFRSSLFAVSGGPRPLLCQLCESEPWSQCVKGQETRLYNECGEHTSFACRPMAQTRLCGVAVAQPVAPPLEPIIFAAVAILVSLAFVIRAATRNRERQRPLYLIMAAIFITLSAVFTITAYSSVEPTADTIFLQPENIIVSAFAVTEQVQNPSAAMTPLLLEAVTLKPDFQYIPEEDAYSVIASSNITSLCGYGNAEAYYVYSKDGGQLTEKSETVSAEIPSTFSMNITTVKACDKISYSVIVIDKNKLPVYGGRIDAAAPCEAETLEIEAELFIPVDGPSGEFYEAANISERAPFRIKAGNFLGSDMTVINRGAAKPVQLELEYGIADLQNNSIVFVRENITLDERLELRRKIRVPPETKEGFYSFYAMLFDLTGRRRADTSEIIYVYVVAVPGPAFPQDIILIFMLYVILLLILFFAYYNRDRCYICKKTGVQRCSVCRKYVCKRHLVKKKEFYCIRHSEPASDKGRKPGIWNWKI